MNILYEIGAYGPIILIILSWYFLWDNNNLFFYYTVGVFVNAVINLILKGIIQEPRPIFDSKIIKLASTHTKHQFYSTGVPFDIYGMPSGHAQGAFYSFGFICFALGNPIITMTYLAIALNTAYQRVKYKNHTIMQVICGGIIGTIMGSIFYFFSAKKITGLLKYKKDDNAPL